MESRFRLLFLVLPVFALGLSGCAATKNLFGWGEEEAPPPAEIPEGQVIEPEVERRQIKEPKIDSEDFEIGAFAGIMSIEDFGSDLVYGVKLAYHVTEGFFVEGSVGRTEGGLTSFEVLSGGAPLLTDSERELTYYNLNVGYNILPGEGFIGEGRAYNTAFYVIAGLGSTSFAGDDRFTVNFGAGYRFLVT
ncbi:MAG: outer membrane beta-barrel domain-containing protein, partial [Gammaproteobacteria bacterium]